MKRRWKEHVSVSMRTMYINCSNRFYKSYQDIICHEDTLGNYQQLEQLIGICVVKSNLTLIN